MSDSGITPSRTIVQSLPSMRTIVDARTFPVSPPSRINDSRLPNCFTIWSAFVHDGKPERFALVPVTGPPTASIRAVLIRELGHRSATRPVLPVTLSGSRCVASITRVRAPGQNL